MVAFEPSATFNRALGEEPHVEGANQMAGD